MHNTLRSDAGRDLHDHPWWSISIVLLGGYWEIMPTEQEQPAKWDARPETTLLRGYRRAWRRPGSIVFRRATDRHRLEIPEGGEAWSLFIMGPWQRKLGLSYSSRLEPLARIHRAASHQRRHLSATIAVPTQ